MRDSVRCLGSPGDPLSYFSFPCLLHLSTYKRDVPLFGGTDGNTRFKNLTQSGAERLLCQQRITVIRNPKGKITSAHYRNDEIVGSHCDNPVSKRPPTGQRYSYPERIEETALYAWRHKPLPRAGTGADLFVRDIFRTAVLDNLSTAKPCDERPLRVDRKRSKPIALQQKPKKKRRPIDIDGPSEPIAA